MAAGVANSGGLVAYTLIFPCACPLKATRPASVSPSSRAARHAGWPGGGAPGPGERVPGSRGAGCVGRPQISSMLKCIKLVAATYT